MAENMYTGLGIDPKMVEFARLRGYNPDTMTAADWQTLEPDIKAGAVSNPSAFGAGNTSLNPYTDAKGNLSGYGQLQAGLGLGQLGLGLAGFLDARKTAKKQREVMDQQIASNKFALDTAQTRAGDISKQFGAGGLASTYK